MSGQFSDFYNSLDADPLKRGKQFEHFVKWFLKNDPEWATQVDQVWLWNEWPGRWGADCGIDLVFRHKNGEHWAVQAKCYSPDYGDISKHDVDTFLSESSRKEIITHRLLIATTDGIGANARRVCDDHGVIRFLLSDFEKSALDYPANLSELPQAKRKPRPEPRDHQIEARTAVVLGLQTADRGQLIMACGTGKTYVTLWIKEAINAQRTLVLVPSLGLLSQLLREWTFAAATPFQWLCVCSDQTVTKGHDEAIHSVHDLGVDVTSDTEKVKRFLSGAGNRVVFATYQSSSVIAAAQADPAIPAFDLAVADEAHRCAGKVGSDFTAILDNAQIRSAKRLFATATPRTYSSTVHKAAEDRGVEVVGMDNAALFGEVLYALPFGKAIERKLLTDYRVVIIGVDDPTIAQWIANRELVSTGTGIETDSESLAAQIGLLKAIKDYDLKRIISFHSRVSRAEAFAADIGGIMEWISDEHRPSGTLRTDFVSGNMPANKRKIKLDQLKALSADERGENSKLSPSFASSPADGRGLRRGLLSNARCLSEGVDVPSLDGVAFIDPRSSQVDIIQAVGRAIRLSPDKKAGTIVLPVFIAAGEDAASTIEASNFKPIWDVLNALKAHDDVLACELDQIRTEMGRKPGSGISADGLRKISIDLPATVDASFSSALRTYLVEQVTASWDERFGELQAYQAEHGDADVPQAWATGLGTWVINQRAAKKGRRKFLSEKQIRRLDEIGFNWNSLESQWEKRFSELLVYKAKHGDMNVPAKSPTGLGMWVGMQRTFQKRGSLPIDRYRRLSEIGFAWDGVESLWEERFGELLAYKEKNGDVNIPNDRTSKLWRWISTQRIFRKKGKLSTEEIQRLDALGFTWDMLESQWNSKISELLAYKEKFGNVNVPKHRFASLGGWVQAQRMRKNEGSLTEERIRQLNEIGFVWNPFESQWETKFCELLAYWKVHGNTNVPTNWPNGLNGWARAQRADKREGRLPEEKIRRLEEIGFIWNPHEALWEAGFCELLSYKTEHGHVNVPHSVTGLGAWVGSQRSAKKKGKISVERIQRLEEIGFEWERNNKFK